VLPGPPAPVTTAGSDARDDDVAPRAGR